MFLYALKASFAKKRRLMSTALSVVLGVAFLSGTFVFTDTIRRTFDDLFADIYDSTDTFVRSESEVEMEFGPAQRGRIPDSILTTLAAIDGVADAQGVVQGYAQLVDADGEAIGDPGTGAPTLGMSFTSGELSPWRLTEGSRAPGSGELAIDQGSATRGDLQLGDDVTVLTQTGSHTLPLVGILRFGSVDSPGGASVAVFDLPTAQRVLLNGVPELDAAMISALPGVSETELTARVAAALPAGVEALTGTEITAETQDDMKEGLSFFNTFLLVFAAIGLVVACFTIYNTFQIIVTQRSREMALLRAVGATRSQVLRAQLFEALFVGLLASLAGLAVGVLVAAGLKALMAAFGIDIPAGGTVILARTAVVALVTGTILTIASAVFPSIRASKTPPIAAIRALEGDASTRSRRRLTEGSVVTLLGAAGFAFGLVASEILWVGLGALAMLLGAFVLGPLIAPPFTRLIGAGLPRISGVPGDLARENALRNPKRTARTGGALMIGVALVMGITVISASVKDWIRDVVGEQFTGDFVIDTDTFGFGGVSPALAVAANALPQVDVATGIRVGAARVADSSDPDGVDTTFIAVDPATVGEVFDIGLIEGSVEQLTSSGLLVHDSEARRRNLAVGDTVTLGFINGSQHVVTIEGIYTEEELAGDFVISQVLSAQSGIDQFDFAVYVQTAPGVSEPSARAALTQLAAGYPNVALQSRGEYIDDQAAQINQLVNLMYGLLALAVIIALFSIANSMSLSIHERTHEIGLLRAVGMTRHQTATAIRWEAVIIAVIGAAIGLVLGVLFGWGISVAIRGEGLGAIAFPWRPMLVILAIAIAGGVVASVRPAHRATRIDVMTAISSE